jgi:hypothetical protein
MNHAAVLADMPVGRIKIVDRHVFHLLHHSRSLDRANGSDGLSR